MSTRERDFLESNRSFQAMPDHIRGWILASPNATADFATFFEKGGTIQADPNQSKPLYRPSSPPSIVVNESEWAALRQYGTNPWPQRHMFGMLAHEIGHDKDNTTRPFPAGGSRDEYVQYRSEIEATAIFNAFPIFKDLKDTPEFSKEAPFDSIGYLHGIELAKLYREWNAGELNDKQVVSAIASKVADTRYTLGGPLSDQDGNGVLTHRDAYLQDFEHVLRPKSEAQPSGRGSDDEPKRPQLNDHGRANPEDTLWQNTREKTQEAFAQHGIKPSDQALDCIAGCLSTQARRDGLDRIDHVLLSQHPDGEIGRNVIAVEGHLDDPSHKRSHVNTKAAENVSLEESMRNLATLDAQRNQQPTREAESVDRPLVR
ncbi:hypothetical protein GLE_4764 [Lysobacter enzymogenes]|uniref:X-Tfes XVIPCD domain-containing protein n=1 Tax=Lysobacter enzymogenes TaxID=69 RepID=A0A0S2DP02_LYSEN|nr:XVIPCD domain-containing protein [Lysobacter enzymogenes]ALN60105.1 hypothetical protein GLE_4764 [Lysobacter enzymogenes]QCW28116.1 hypothetical protein FE772_23165 [Lysobacter enzymogenes]